MTLWVAHDSPVQTALLMADNFVNCELSAACRMYNDFDMIQAWYRPTGARLGTFPTPIPLGRVPHVQ